MDGNMRKTSYTLGTGGRAEEDWKMKNEKKYRKFLGINIKPILGSLTYVFGIIPNCRNPKKKGEEEKRIIFCMNGWKKGENKNKKN